MPRFVVWSLAVSSILVPLLCYLATSDIAENLSPQGCRMSWMSPSYVLQADFNESWSPLARRYSLWLYREVGWDPVQGTDIRKDSLPVLFIPGNAGSSHQVRSIASSASRQYFPSPYIVSPDFESRSVKPLDFFAVEFNEDLSAFHGSTLQSQIAYTSKAIAYILSLYPPGTSIIVMGHSMGGIVAMSLLPSEHISAIITMSTPHTLPPARFDSRIDDLYATVRERLEKDPTPVMSVCGGAMDMMIPSESCILPRTAEPVYRRTVFTSALEGAWTGVGHREMVWCHQVRWRIARAALELGGKANETSRSLVLDSWLRGGHSDPPRLDHKDAIEINSSESSTLPPGQTLVLKNPTAAKTYLLPVTEDSSTPKLTVLVSQGAIPPVSPEHAIPLRVTVLSCNDVASEAVNCVPMPAETLKLIPNPVPGKPFPVPQEGSDESEGVVLFEAYVPRISDRNLVGIQVDNADGRGWIVASVDSNKPVASGASTYSLIMGPLHVSIPKHEGVSTSFTFPNLLSSALVVYRVTPKRSLVSSCSDSLLPPLLVHTSHPEETHYFPLIRTTDKRILLHTHLTAPFIDRGSHFPSAVNFTIYSSGEQRCRDDFESFDIAIDWSATFGRWGSRYWTSVAVWSAGLASMVVYLAWLQADSSNVVPSVGQSLQRCVQLVFRYLLPLSLISSAIPLPESLYLGNKGDLFFAPIAPLVLSVSGGLVCLSWGILTVLLTVIGKVSFALSGRRREMNGVPRSTVFSLAMICMAIFAFIPWQVAYLGCWLLHLYTCASSTSQLRDIMRQEMDAVPLITRSGTRESPDFLSDSPSAPSGRRKSEIEAIKQDNLNHNLHILLLMTWLLPLTAPVLAVWVRTLLTAGYTTPFDGDHNFLAVLPFLIFADYASWTPQKLFSRPRFENWISLRWLFAIVATTAFIFGSRRPYLVLDTIRIAMWVVVACKIGSRYWGGSPRAVVD